MDSEPAGEQKHARASDAGLTRYQQSVRKFEFVTVTALQVLVILTVAVATVVLFVLFVNGLRTQVTKVGSVEHLQPIVQDVFSGVFMVVLGLELLETLTAYFREHHIRLELILLVAIIAVGRSIFEFDLAHTPGFQLFGYGALILCLAISYVLVRNAHKHLQRN